MPRVRRDRADGVGRPGSGPPATCPGSAAARALPPAAGCLDNSGLGHGLFGTWPLVPLPDQLFPSVPIPTMDLQLGHQSEESPIEGVQHVQFRRRANRTVIILELAGQFPPLLGAKTKRGKGVGVRDKLKKNEERKLPGNSWWEH